MRHVGRMLRKVGVFLVVLKRCFTNQGWQTLLNGVERNGLDGCISSAVVLSVSKCIGALRGVCAGLDARGKPRCVQRAQCGCCKSRISCNAARCFTAAVANSKSEGVIRHTRHDPRCCIASSRGAGDVQGNHIAALHAQLCSRCARHQQRIVPGDLGDDVRQLLQPTNVGEATVEHLAVNKECQFQTIALSASINPRGHCLGGKRRGRSCFAALGGVGADARVQVGSERAFKVCAGLAGHCHVRASHQIHSSANLIARDCSAQFDRTATAVCWIKERGNERLRETDGAVGGTGIAPTLQEVRHRNMPSASGSARCFIDAVRQMHHVLRLRHSSREAQINWCIKDWVRTHHYQRVDGTGIERGDHLLNADAAHLRIGSAGVNGHSVGAELAVDGGCKRVRHGGLARASNHQGLATSLLEVSHQRIDYFLIMLAELRCKRGHLARAFHADAVSHCCSKRSNLRRSHGDALISVHASQCQEAFHLIDATHGSRSGILGNQGAVFALHQRATSGPCA